MSPVDRDVSDDDDIESQPDIGVMLGFVDDAEQPAALLRHRFPSKVGGRPAWLDPLNLPDHDLITCPFSGRPLLFLLQVYGPLDDNPDAFHRTIFLFVSAEGDRLGQPGTVQAFRSQLPRQNAFYSYHPPKDLDIVPPTLQPGDCEVSLERDPWKVVEAERALAEGQEAAAVSGVSLFPEMELVVEPEGLGEGGAESKEVQRMLEEYHQRVSEEGELDDEELPEAVMQQVQDALDPERQHFAEFQAKIAPEPEQVLRYCFHPAAQPLWPSTSHRPSPEDIPHCPRCGCPRHFEFQVLPQLLNSLGVDDLDPKAHDWGTIAVYTCSKSCALEAAPGRAYAEEFCWFQPP